jgi:hypothetical protein
VLGPSPVGDIVKQRGTRPHRSRVLVVEADHRAGVLDSLRSRIEVVNVSFTRPALLYMLLIAVAVLCGLAFASGRQHLNAMAVRV